MDGPHGGNGAEGVRTVIYYFSGTGNSLHVARGLRERVPGAELEPVLAHLGRDAPATDAPRVGLVFPVYMNCVPVQVRRLVRRLSMPRARYVFAVATHGGYANAAYCELLLERLLRDAGGLSAFFDVEMTMNTPRGLVPSWLPGGADWADHVTKGKVEQGEAAPPGRLDDIAKAILEGDPRRGVPGLGRRLKGRLMAWLTRKNSATVVYHADDACNGCGLCERVCLSGKVRMAGGRPERQRDVKCFYCYACFNFCPQQAILVRPYLKKDGRYHHPAVKLDDIAAQKGR